MSDGWLRLGTGGLSDEHRRLLSLAAFAALLLVCVVGLLPFRKDENVGAIALIMLLPPLAATGAGPVAAGGAAIASGLAFNFFFTHPYHSPAIESPASIAAFVVYLVIAISGAVVIARLREARALATRRAADATLMQALTIELIQNAEARVTLRSALVQLAGTLGLRGVCLMTVAGADQLVALAGESERAERVAHELLDGGGEQTGRVVALREPGKPAAFPIRTTDTAFGFVVADPGPRALGPDREKFLESFTGVVALALTRARLGEERVRRLALEETDKLRTVLLQSVSHDLRTPLTTIKTTAAALRGDLEPGQRLQLLADVEQEVDRLSHLVTNLLDLSRIESGSLQLDRQPVPLDDLVDDAIAAAGGDVDRTRLDVDLPSEVAILDVDETLVRQVLVNLLQNAARYAPGNGPIRVEAATAAGGIEIRVIDHGPGVPEPERLRIFEPYKRSRPGVRGAGSGLGLAISRGFVAAHGGTLDVQTTPGGGATFVVTLPTATEQRVGT